MRAAIAVICAVFVVGCGKTPQVGLAPVVPQPSQPIILPDFRPIGRVQSININAKFAMLSFSISGVAAPGKVLTVFRDGTKVGQVKVTGPQQGENTIADLVSGDVQVGDEVREE